MSNRIVYKVTMHNPQYQTFFCETKMKAIHLVNRLMYRYAIEAYIDEIDCECDTVEFNSEDFINFLGDK